MAISESSSAQISTSRKVQYVLIANKVFWYVFGVASGVVFIATLSILNSAKVETPLPLATSSSFTSPQILQPTPDFQDIEQIERPISLTIEDGTISFIKIDSGTTGKNFITWETGGKREILSNDFGDIFNGFYAVEKDNIIFAKADLLGDGVNGGMQFNYFDPIASKRHLAIEENTETFRPAINYQFSEKDYSKPSKWKIVWGIPNEECDKLAERQSYDFSLKTLDIVRDLSEYPRKSFPALTLNKVIQFKCIGYFPSFGVEPELPPLKFVGVSLDLMKAYFAPQEDIVNAKELYVSYGQKTSAGLQGKIEEVTHQRIEIIDREGNIRSINLN